MHIPDVAAAMGRVGRACAEAGKTDATRVPDLVRAREWRHHCFPMFVVASEHGCMLQDARAVADGISEPS
ncbi:hypothetical protein [Jannaschia seosinensis]|nr:hypothetical protein [Jannaschia seosinensis]